MDIFNNLDFWAWGTNTPPTPTMMVNKLGRSEHKLFTPHDYNINTIITKILHKISNIYRHVKMEEGLKLRPKSNFQTISEIRGGRYE